MLEGGRELIERGPMVPQQGDRRYNFYPPPIQQFIYVAA